MVSRFERRHGRSDFLDDADAFVAQNATRLTGRDVALEDVQVGSADRRLGDFDDRVRGRLDVRLRMILQGFLARPQIHERFHRPGCCGFGTDCWFWHRRGETWSVTFQVRWSTAVPLSGAGLLFAGQWGVMREPEGRPPSRA